MTQEQIAAAFSAIVTQPRAATTLGISKQTINNYRQRGASVGKQLELLWRVGKLRFKDDWDE